MLKMCHNTTAIANLIKQGRALGPGISTRKLSTCKSECWSTSLLSINRLGIHNKLADSLSWNRIDSTDWSFSPRSCRKLLRLWGTQQVDFFAAPNNHKLQTWFSKIPHTLATGTDAFNQTWTGQCVFAFLPIILIQKIPLRIRDQAWRSPL